jgi:hypothetical protein
MRNPLARMLGLTGLLVNVSLCALALAASGQKTTTLPSSDALAKQIKRDYVDPVVESLHETAKNDKSLQMLLDRLELWIDPKLTLDLQPIAEASVRLPGKSAPVRINLWYVYELMNYAEFAAVALTGTELAGEALERFGFDYGAALGQAAAAKEPPPRFSFQFRKYVQDPGWHVPMDFLTERCFRAALAWTILHEIGHHILGHTQQMPGSLAESRADETAADLWAFSKMRQFGYGLAPLEAVLAAKEVAEEIRSMIPGMQIQESRSTHPSYSTRHMALNSRFKCDAPPRADVRVYAWTGVVSGKAHMVQVAIPYREAEDYIASFCMEDSGCGFRLFEASGGALKLYGRDSQHLEEITIHEPHALKPRVNIWLKNLRDGMISESTTRGIQVDMPFFASEFRDGKTIRQMFEITPRAIVGDALMKAGAPAASMERVIAVYLETSRRVKQTLLSYAKGQLSLIEVRERTRRADLEQADKVRTLLGPSVYERFQDATLSNNLVQLGLTKILELKPGAIAPQP